MVQDPRYLWFGLGGDRFATSAEPSHREHDQPEQERQALSQCPANCCGGKATPHQYPYETEHENGVRPVHEDIRRNPVAGDEQ